MDDPPRQDRRSLSKQFNAIGVPPRTNRRRAPAPSAPALASKTKTKPRTPAAPLFSNVSYTPPPSPTSFRSPSSPAPRFQLPSPKTTSQVEQDVINNSVKIWFDPPDAKSVYSKISGYEVFPPDEMDLVMDNPLENVRQFMSSFPLKYAPSGAETLMNSGIIDGRLIPGSESFWEDLLLKRLEHGLPLQGYYPWEDSTNIILALTEYNWSQSAMPLLLDKYHQVSKSRIDYADYITSNWDAIQTKFQSLWDTAKSYLPSQKQNPLTQYLGSPPPSLYINGPQYESDLTSYPFRPFDPNQNDSIWPSASTINRYKRNFDRQRLMYKAKYNNFSHKFKPYIQRMKKALPYAGIAGAAAAAAGLGYGAYNFYRDATVPTAIGRVNPFKIIKNSDGSYSARSTNRPDFSITNPVSWFTSLPYAIADSINSEKLVDLYGPEWKQSKHPGVQLKLPKLTAAQFKTLSPVNQAAYLKSGHSIPT
jgi:hypothetical protein